jgi:hypothetical protein
MSCERSPGTFNCVIKETRWAGQPAKTSWNNPALRRLVPIIQASSKHVTEVMYTGAPTIEVVEILQEDGTGAFTRLGVWPIGHGALDSP